MTGIAAITAFSGSGVVAAASVSLTDQHLTESAIGTVTASYTIGNDGLVTSFSETLEGWLLGSGGSVGDYQVMATAVSGTVSSGTVGSWLSCSTSRTWTKTNSARNNSTATAVLNVSIRRASDSVVLDTATITMSAESESSGGGPLP